MSKFLDALVGRLPAPIQPYVKATVPLALAAVLVVQDLTVTAVELNSLAVAAGGAVTSLLVLVFPNRPT